MTAGARRTAGRLAVVLALGGVAAACSGSPAAPAAGSTRATGAGSSTARTTAGSNSTGPSTAPAATTSTASTSTASTPTASTPTASTPGTGRATVSATPRPTPPPLQAPLRLQAPGRLTGEGRFRAVVSHGGRPVLQVAYLRADAVHGSDEAAVVWFDHRATRYELHPGWLDPGHLSLWNQPDTIPPAARAALLATFNGGFKTPELRGGFYENGHIAGELLPGAASVVIYRDGSVQLGAWGSEVSMTPQVVAVRQNLSLLIDHRRIVGGLGSNVEANWGPTIGGGPDVWRSGLGITAAGDLVLVMGDALTPQTLANLLGDAGSVRAMEMDINPAWMSFMWYTRGQRSDSPVSHKLLDFQEPADRYFTDTSRDFFVVDLR